MRTTTICSSQRQVLWTKRSVLSSERCKKEERERGVCPRTFLPGATVDAAARGVALRVQHDLRAYQKRTTPKRFYLLGLLPLLSPEPGLANDRFFACKKPARKKGRRFLRTRGDGQIASDIWIYIISINRRNSPLLHTWVLRLLAVQPTREQTESLKPAPRNNVYQKQLKLCGPECGDHTRVFCLTGCCTNVKRAEQVPVRGMDVTCEVSAAGAGGQEAATDERRHAHAT